MSAATFSRRTKILGGAAIIFMPFVLLFVLELTFRSMGFGNPILYREHTAYRYAPQPNQSQVRRHNAQVTIDSVGLRTIRDWHEPTDRRILFIGDSVTWGGTYLDDTAVFAISACTHLENILDGKSTCGNAGVNAYGIDNMTMRLRYKSFDGEDAIVVVILSEDALRGLTSVRQMAYHTRPIPGPLPALSELALFALDRIRTQARFGGSAPSSAGDDAINYDVAQASLDRLFVELERAARGGKTVLVVHTPSLQAVVGDYNELERFVLTQIADSGFPFIEMRRYLVGENVQQLFYDSMHLSEAGHALYAAVIARELAELMSEPELQPDDLQSSS
jgi:hypothetical protein